MTQRKPGDYVINAELTDEQRERFVRDCVAAGAKDQSGYDPGFGLTLWDNDDISDVSEYPTSCRELSGTRNVSHEYKAQPQLMRQIEDAMERNPEGWWEEYQFWGHASGSWIRCASGAQVLSQMSCTEVRPKPRTYTLHVQEMPEPLREEPEPGEYVYLISTLTGNVCGAQWDGSCRMGAYLDCGLVYSDEPTAREALEKLTKAMMGGK